MNQWADGPDLLTLNPDWVKVYYPSLIQELTDRVAGLVGAWGPDSRRSQSFVALPVFSADIHRFGVFTSPLLLRWVGIGGQSLEDLGHWVGTGIEAQRGWGLSPRVWVSPSGWLSVQFSEVDLGQWLDRLLWTSPRIDLPEMGYDLGVSADPILFGLQYCHACCCRLLRLAEDKGISLGAETVMPWLDGDGTLQLRSVCEQQVLVTLMRFPLSLSSQKIGYGDCSASVLGEVSYLEWPTKRSDLLHQAQRWSDVFLDFHRGCQFFGEVNSRTSDLLLARLGLVFILKGVFAFYLRNILKVDAPIIL